MNWDKNGVCWIIVLESAEEELEKAFQSIHSAHIEALLLLFWYNMAATEPIVETTFLNNWNTGENVLHETWNKIQANL